MAESELDGGKLFLERLHRSDEWHDEITIRTVPRFKTSGLSGDEWRTSAVLEVRRKGRVVYGRSYHQIADAAKHLPWLLTVYAEDAETGIDPDMTRDLCMQPGCPERATVLYRKIANGCGSCGATRPIDDPVMAKYRAFCGEHARRGDSNLDDMDSIHELVAGQPGAIPLSAMSPAEFGGSVMLDDLPAFLARVRKDQAGA